MLLKRYGSEADTELAIRTKGVGEQEGGLRKHSAIPNKPADEAEGTEPYQNSF